MDRVPAISAPLVTPAPTGCRKRIEQPSRNLAQLIKEQRAPMPRCWMPSTLLAVCGRDSVPAVLDEMEVQMAEYEAPMLEVVGSVAELTLDEGSPEGDN